MPEGPRAAAALAGAQKNHLSTLRHSFHQSPPGAHAPPQFLLRALPEALPRDLGSDPAGADPGVALALRV